MYARSVTIQAQPGSIDEGIAFVRDKLTPAASSMAGFVGLSMICDRESGRCITTSAWSSQDTMSSSETMMQPWRRRGGEILGAPPSVDRWEIPVVHRHAVSGEDACVRCTWLKLDSAGLIHAIDTYRMGTLPVLEEMDGFCSASLMVDHTSGRAVSSAAFTSRDAMVASRSGAEALRARTAEEFRASVTDIHEFELSLAHLHLPEIVSARRS